MTTGAGIACAVVCFCLGVLLGHLLTARQECAVRGHRWGTTCAMFEGRVRFCRCCRASEREGTPS